MKFKAGMFLPALLILAVFLGACSPKAELPPEIPAVTGEFEFSVLKVGQADAIILKTQNHCVVIDCGEVEDGDEVAEHLNKNGIADVDYLFITHYDKDHVGGVPSVLDAVNVERIYAPDYEGDCDEYFDYLDALEGADVSPVLLKENMSFTLDDVLFCVYPPMREAYAEDDNDFSLAIAAYHGENSFLFTGDAESDRLAEILDQTNRARFDFLKVPHHGRYNKNTKKFFETVSPKYGVICTSDKNPAKKKTLEALETVNCKAYETRNGDVTVASDGKTLTVEQ